MILHSDLVNLKNSISEFLLHFLLFHFPMTPPFPRSPRAVASLPEGVTKQQFHPNFTAPPQQCRRTEEKEQKVFHRFNLHSTFA